MFYILVVGGLGGLEHLGDQAATDWPWLVGILVGFGIQVALLAELRRRRRLHGAAKTTAGAGSGASVVGMVACCAHHVADLVPILGASGAAIFLTEFRVPIMAAGLAVNGLGVAVALRRLLHAPAPTGGQTCHA
ncbi:unnamed protein product [[Actinomadura] parvosata subsp. kistnae]|uniref:Uncharacterized protein n=2 Tax=Nonomuraea TaxID=83681 RepID=A0A1U9ZYS5_9ACTN|nr:hypothetical protein BKM31_18000 [Nonomuraea sp. ATCC 55076]SPL98737.1 unnamed protein product [Actinomadura parvosata subsp. kistnae]